MVQYNVFPLGTPSPPVTTLYVVETPSFIDVDGELNEYVLSPILTLALVALIGPDVEVVLIDTVNASVPSVNASFANVTVNEPVPDVIVKEPDTATKSASDEVILLIVQYRVVPLGTNDVITLNVPDGLPSFTCVGIVSNLYDGAAPPAFTRKPKEVKLDAPNVDPKVGILRSYSKSSVGC
jgi:hypothetical protein